MGVNCYHALGEMESNRLKREKKKQGTIICKSVQLEAGE